MNWITIAGNLGSDPEERFTPGGAKVTSFRVATRSRKKGEEVTVWYRVTVWGDRFDKMMPYVKKGSSIIVSGELGKPDIYNNREGQPQVGLEITADSLRFSPFGKPTNDQQAGQPVVAQAANPYGAPAPTPTPVAASPMGSPMGSAPSDDDLPF